LKKRVVILGSTGSIGTQALDVLRLYPEQFEIEGLAVRQNIDLLIDQIYEYSPAKVVVADEKKALELKNRVGSKIQVSSGEDALVELAASEDVDIVLVALVGIAGLKPTIAALKAGKTVALATKEVLVAGGEIITKLASESGTTIIPVDSEHSAIFQCLQGCSNVDKEVNKIYLTASGGPFRGYKRDELKRVTVEDALKHPNWKMGPKVTIDSATLMNKGLEVIEAKWLFNLSVDQIDVVVHPQSIIHSMVEFVDGAILAQMGSPDMRIPILYAFTYPERYLTNVERLNLIEMGNLSFEQPDIENFPCLSLAYKAIRIGGTMPAVLNAANEVAVDMFLKGNISFLEIPIIIEKAMKSHQVVKDPEVEDILHADLDTRELLI
jgi:1-deoxy-D-xylulose 5-phosphate reductoisomerase (EC 1.1.1.267)